MPRLEAAQNPPGGGGLVRLLDSFGADALAGLGLAADDLRLLHPDFQIVSPGGIATPDEGNLHSLQLRFKYAEEFMLSRVIEQPEAVAGMIAATKQQALKGYNRHLPPNVFYLMGLPGVGKDTIAKAYVDALWGETGAWKKHMMELPIIKSKDDQWGLFGAATGYRDSAKVSPLLRFVIEHSGGRYEIREGEDGPYPVENPKWKPGATPPLEQSAPERAVIFVNEAHDWSKIMKNAILKRAIESGSFQVNNPGGDGVSEIHVPVTFVFASNEGISLLTSRELNGQRFGPRLQYEQIMANWRNAHNNPDRLLATLMATNGSRNAAGYESAPGNSEELLDRIPKPNIFLLRPISPAGLKRIAELALEGVREGYRDGHIAVRNFNLRWTPRVVELAQEFQYDAERNARPVKANVATLVENPLSQAILAGTIAQPSRLSDMMLDVERVESGAYELVVTVSDPARPVQSEAVRIPIPATEVLARGNTVSDSQLERLGTLAERVKKRVVGLDSIVDQVCAKIIARREMGLNGGSVDAEYTAQILGFFGISSAGKSELAKAFFAELGGVGEMPTINLNGVQSIQDVKDRFLGTPDGRGGFTRSDFMKHWDRTYGSLFIAIEEASNAGSANPMVSSVQILKALYDIFGEVEVSTFVDNEPRRMGGVTIVMLGNAGDEIYKDLPKDAPDAMRFFAMHEAYRNFVKDPAAKRNMLEKYFPGPLLNRAGVDNIYFFPPFGFAGVRRLAYLQTQKMVDSLAPLQHSRGWNIEFSSPEAYQSYIETIEEHGFNLDEQGRSVAQFSKVVASSVRSTLLEHNIPSGATVRIASGPDTIVKLLKDDLDMLNSEHDYEPRPEREVVMFHLQDERGTEIATLEIPRRLAKEDLAKSDTDLIITAYHEAGHEVARRVLLGEKQRSILISILPGITFSELGAPMLYDGVARYKRIEAASTTWETARYHIAVLLAGGEAERLVSKGGVVSAGVHDDYRRANTLAERILMESGLSKSVPFHTKREDQSMESFRASLTTAEVKGLEAEKQQMLKESARIARRVLLRHFSDALAPMATKLAEKGRLFAPALQEIYAQSQVGQESAKTAARWSFRDLRLSQLRAGWAAARHGREGYPELIPGVPRPEKILRMEEYLRAKRLAEVAGVPLPINAPIAEAKANVCNLLLLGMGA